MIEKFNQELFAILSPLLGDSTMKMYKSFYKNSSPIVMLKDSEELLSELFGPVTAKKHLQPLYDEYIKE